MDGAEEEAHRAPGPQTGVPGFGSRDRGGAVVALPLSPMEKPFPSLAVSGTTPRTVGRCVRRSGRGA